MIDEQQHQEVILVRDKVLAAALFASGHRALMTHEDSRVQQEFYCVFAITSQLRKDIRRYYGDDLNVSVRELNQELLDLSMHLADYECWVHAKLSEFYAGQADN